jgi:hypothetical protein
MSISIPEGEDFTSSSATVVIPPDQTQGCADLPITDDELALEGDEEFMVSATVEGGGLDPPTPPATVTIEDDDGMYVCVHVS